MTRLKPAKNNARGRRPRPERQIASLVSDQAYNIAKSVGLRETVRMFEASLIAAALEENEGNLCGAARTLSLPSTTLQSKRAVMESEIQVAGRQLHTVGLNL